MMKRCALYVRVSTAEQRDHGLSVDNQIQALQEYCEANNYQIVGIYNDAGFSARKSYKKRPAMNQMILDCQAGKIDLILVTKLDRFFRSVKDYYEVISQIGDIPWRTIWEDYETETSSGVFKVNIMLSVAQSEADRTSERIKSTLDYKRSKGDYIGTPPFGYLRENGKLIKDQETAHLVELMFKTYLTTWSSLKTVQALSDVGYDLNMNALRKRLKNSVYAGDAQGNECPAYISMEDHRKIMDNMKKYIREPKNGYDYIFSGMLTCPYCGNRLGSKATFNTLANGEKSPCKYYVCDGKLYKAKHDQRISISEKKMEKYLLDQFDQATQSYNLKFEAESVDHDLSIKKTKLRDRLDRVGIRFEDGDLSVEEYREKRSQILAELDQLDQMESHHDPIILPSGWKDTYNQLDDLHKRAFWRSMISSIEVQSDKSFKIKFEH